MISLAPKQVLEGTVVDARTGAPLNGVTIVGSCLEGCDDVPSSTSDRRGRFRMETTAIKPIHFQVRRHRYSDLDLTVSSTAPLPLRLALERKPEAMRMEDP